MKIEKIKPIPKYIEKKIIAMDKNRQLTYNQKRFYAYFTKNDGELTKVTVAARRHKDKIYLKQVAVHGVDSNVCFAKDINCHYIAGYSVGWYDMGLTKQRSWYEDSIWYECTPEKAFDPYALLINVEYIKTIPEFKYSAVELYGYDENTLKYLRTYRQYPEVEFITKLGLSNLSLSKQILKLARVDKGFRKWLGKNRQMLRYSSFDIKVVIDAYKTKKDIRVLQQLHNKRKDLYHSSSLENLRAFVKGETDKFIAYANKQQIDFHTYNDYRRACEYLGIDMTLERNRYPHDFKTWHDIRSNEYHSEQAKRDEENRKQFYENFRAVAIKYNALQYEKIGFICIIAKSPNELKEEGSTLHHCVGKMGYDQKFVDEKSLIFFIRTKEEPNKPLVTVEYSIKDKKVLQCYGEHNSKPSEEILSFVNKKWLPYTKRQMKQIAA